MADVTRILQHLADGKTEKSDELLVLVYDELRRLASSRLAEEKPGQTLQATALVHEAYLRLVKDTEIQWNGRGHFFAAAAEAMRRILVDLARRKNAVKHGGNFNRETFEDIHPVMKSPGELVELNDVLDRLAALRPQAAQVVKLRVFAGLTNEQIALAIGISERTCRRVWTFARAWLRKEMSKRSDGL